MRRFADWGQTKEWVFVTEECPDNEIYLETGCPKYALMDLIDEGWRVFICDGKLTNKLRKELEWEKTDENDAKLVQELFHGDPTTFKEFTKPQQITLHKNLMMSEYVTITRLGAALRIKRKAFLREFGRSDIFNDLIKICDNKKSEILKKVSPLVTEETHRLSYIKGVGPTIIAGVAGVRHPNNFPNVSAWLNFLGYTKKSRETNKFHRGAKYFIIQASMQVIMHKDPIFKPIYDSKKEIFKKERVCGDCYKKIKKDGDLCKGYKGHMSDEHQICNARADEMARNRIATMLAKEFWRKLHDIETGVLPEEFFADYSQEETTGFDARELFI